MFKENGQHQYVYDDPTENLILVRALLNDIDLPELAFIGLSKSTIEDRLGTPDYIHKDCLVYQHGNNVLILHCYIPHVDGLIDWLKYVRLEEGLNSKEIAELFEW